MYPEFGQKNCSSKVHHFTAQTALLSLNRTSLYYTPVRPSPEEVVPNTGLMPSTLIAHTMVCAASWPTRGAIANGESTEQTSRYCAVSHLMAPWAFKVARQ
jgi:hypothetical protein